MTDIISDIEKSETESTSECFVNVKFVKGLQEWELKARNGQKIIDLVRENDVDLECACEGSLSCSTCHVVLRDQCTYETCCQITPICEAENDMLDLATGLTITSRLGCQVILTPELEGAIFDIPHDNRNSAPVSSPISNPAKEKFKESVDSR